MGRNSKPFFFSVHDVFLYLIFLFCRRRQKEVTDTPEKQDLKGTKKAVKKIV